MSQLNRLLPSATPSQVTAWIDAALGEGGSVLVHCHEGKSRSVSLVAAWLMASRGMRLAAALDHIRCEGDAGDAGDTLFAAWMPRAQCVLHAALPAAGCHVHCWF